VTVKEIIALNHGMDPKKVEEKQTILIPGGRLSSRDKEILAGVNLTSASSDIFSVSQSFSLARIQHALSEKWPMKRLEWLEAVNYGVLHAGIGPRTYRTYPVRAGENIKDIISKRDITRVEVDQLNPEVNLDKLTGASLLESPKSTNQAHHTPCRNCPVARAQ
jgi:hypothetical protein